MHDAILSATLPSPACPCSYLHANRITHRDLKVNRVPGRPYVCIICGLLGTVGHAPPLCSFLSEQGRIFLPSAWLVLAEHGSNICVRPHCLTMVSVLPTAEECVAAHVQKGQAWLQCQVRVLPLCCLHEDC